MKDLFVWLIVGLLATCAISSIYQWLGWTTEPEPSPYKIGVGGMDAGIMGVEKSDFQYPQLNVVDGADSSGYATDVFAKQVPSNARYPVNGVW